MGKMLVLCSSIGWATFGDLVNMALFSLSLEQVSLGEQGGSAHHVPLPRRAGVWLGMCKGFELLMFSYIPMVYVHSKVIQSRPLSFHH